MVVKIVDQLVPGEDYINGKLVTAIEPTLGGSYTVHFAGGGSYIYRPGTRIYATNLAEEATRIADDVEGWLQNG